AGLAARADEYLAHYPELAADPAAVAELRQAEAGPSAGGPGAGGPAPPGYDLLEELGRGGMGLVYKARQLQLNRLVALKMVLEGEHARPQRLIRFLAEAEAAAAVDHPNVVRVYESGFHAGHPYLAMEFLDGGTLADRIKAGGAMAPRAAAAVVGRIARGVQAAHDLGIVHRDLKPSNVLFDGDGVPKVADFGLAKRGSSGDLTTTGVPIGTPDYMAPEQAGGRGKYVGPPADVWALGVILYECLTGRRPFAASDLMETLRRVQEDTPPPPAPPPKSESGGVPRDLQIVCAKCLEKVPGHRYPTAGALADDLDRLLAGEPIRARAAGPLERAAKWVRRKPALAGLAAALVALVATLSGSWVVVTLRDLRAAEQKAADERDHAARLTEEEARARAATRAAVDVTARLVSGGLEESGDASRWSVWLADVIRSAADAGAEDVEAAARTSFTLWSTRVHRLVRADPISSRGPVQAAAMSPDGTRIASAYRDGVVELSAAPGTAAELPLREPGPVNGLDFSPDGRFLVILRNDRAEVWDGAKRVRTAVVSHPKGLWAAAFSADGRFLATGGEDGRVRITDSAGGDQVCPPLSHGGPVHSVAVSPDGGRVLTGCWDRHARVWDCTTGLQLAESDPQTHRVNSVGFAPDGRTGAFGTWDGVVRLWDLTTGEAGTSLPHPAVPVRALAFSPDGRTLLTRLGETQEAVNRNDAVRLWDVRMGRQQAVLSHVGPVLAAVWTPDGRVMTGGIDGTARVWEADGRPFGAPMYHRDPVRVVVAGAGGRTLLTADTGVRVWQTAPGLPPVSCVLDQPVQQGLFSPDGQLVFAIADRGGVLWTPGGNEPAATPVLPDRLVTGAAFFPDSRRLLIGVADEADRAAEIWDVATARPTGRAFRHPKGRTAVAVSPDGRTVAIGGSDGTAQLWNAETGERIGGPLAQPGGAGVVAFSADGRTVLTAGAGGSARLWDVVAAAARGQPLVHGSAIRAAALSADGRTVFTVGTDGVVRVWDIETAQERTPPLQHGGSVRGLALSRDGRRAATVGNDRLAWVWDLASGDPVGRPLTHPDRVAAVQFSPDGRTLLTGSSDHLARLWDVKTGLPLGPPLRHDGPVRDVRFRPDGRAILTVGLDRACRVWTWPGPITDPPGRVVAAAQRATGLDRGVGQAVRVLDPAAWSRLSESPSAGPGRPSRTP
ncbi:MAG TPA: serine/threonine-protein kinase, partial [Gemmataceae bacterium]|nr:serine/threonine-protein kinase [Gemmataceae bacterium]